MFRALVPAGDLELQRGIDVPTLRIDGKELETKLVGAKDVKVVFETKLTKGIHELSPYFHIPAGQLGAYYVVATKK